MRTLHQQTSAYSRNSLFDSGAKRAVNRRSSPNASSENSLSDQGEQAKWKMLSRSLAAGFGAHFLVLLFCLLTGFVSSLAQGLLLSSLVGLTVFCLGLAFSKGNR